MKARGAPPGQRADQALATVPRCQWRTIRWRHGTKGGLRKKLVAVRAWRLTAPGETHLGWLLGERAARGQADEHKFYWSNLPASAMLEERVDDAHRRHAIEQFHEEAKGEWGWDQYPGRLWPGCHRHAVTVMLALSFLIWQELRERDNHTKRGRPRDPFSLLPDRWRRALPEVHRKVANWLRHQAVLWWITIDRFMELCSLRI